jgi:hypothetical protein
MARNRTVRQSVRQRLATKWVEQMVLGQALTKSLLEATFRLALNFLLALSSNRRDSQNGQIEFGPITSSFDGSKSKNGRCSGATAWLQPRS